MRWEGPQPSGTNPVFARRRCLLSAPYAAVKVWRPRPVRALAVVADTGHAHFTRSLSIADTARMIAEGRGQRGHNIEYLEQTVAHMDELGVRDRRLHQVLAMVRALRERRPRR